MKRVGRTAVRHALRRRNLHSVAQKPSAGQPAVQITTLPNKIRVATESSPGHFSSVGLYVDVGSRYETPSTSGVSHFIDRMAFKSTHSRSSDEISTSIDALGGQILCSASRESIMYQSSHFHQATPLALNIIADTALNAAYIPEELDMQRDAARYEIREVAAKPEMFLPEVLHHVAYSGKTLGNPLMCPEERIDEMGAETIKGFVNEWYRPERMVIAGAGMQHEALVELVDKHFSHLKYTVPPVITPQPSTTHRSPSPSQAIPPHLLPSSSPSLYKSLTRAASSYLYPQSSQQSLLLSQPTQATYTGGHQFIPDPNAEFNHVYLAYEGVGIHDDDVYALAVMQVLLGGGGSFSAGGPGKGMYSRLYTQILNHYPQIDHCASFHHIYTDSALFGLFASFVPAGGSGGAGITPSQVFPHLAHQLSLLCYTPLPKTELARARNQLKSSLMMALESRAVEVEDLGRQILVYGRKVPVVEMCERIDLVGEKDIRRVAGRIWGFEGAGKPSTIVMGREDISDVRGVLKKYGLAT